MGVFLGLVVVIPFVVAATSRCRHEFGMLIVLCKSFSILYVRTCGLHRFSKRWLFFYGNTMQNIYLNDALHFLSVYLFYDCVRAHLFCVVWIACTFRSVCIAFVN